MQFEYPIEFQSLSLPVEDKLPLKKKPRLHLNRRRVFYSTDWLIVRSRKGEGTDPRSRNWIPLETIVLLECLFKETRSSDRKRDKERGREALKSKLMLETIKRRRRERPLLISIVIFQL